MSKGERIEAFVREMNLQGDYDPCYLAYFNCFNQQDYYEAHDVLEHLWLQGRGDANYGFYKGLIQLAGAFVHLKKQFVRPWHPKDGRRLRPAVRLFGLAGKNLASYGPKHLGLDLISVQQLIDENVRIILDSDYTKNPWIPEYAPELRPE